jgi:hypothetical protein
LILPSAPARSCCEKISPQLAALESNHGSNCACHCWLVQQCFLTMVGLLGTAIAVAGIFLRCGGPGRSCLQPQLTDCLRIFRCLGFMLRGVARRPLPPGSEGTRGAVAGLYPVQTPPWPFTAWKSPHVASRPGRVASGPPCRPPNLPSGPALPADS